MATRDTEAAGDSARDVVLDCLLGANRDDRSRRSDVLVATVQTGYREWLLPYDDDGLLIADEVHHCQAESWFAVLEEKFDRRLGLTATDEREDSGPKDYLDPYFDGNVFPMDYRPVRTGGA